MKINPNTDYSALFSSLNTKNSNTSFLSDYASIKNGSYKKLMKAYYASQTTDTKKTSTTTNKSDSNSSAAETVKSAADTFKDSVEALKRAVVSEDTEAIVSKAKEFTDNFNKLSVEVNQYGNSKVKKATTNMIDYMGNSLSTLSKAGFSFSEDGKLSVSEETVKANNSSLKTLFGSKSSFADSLYSKASSVEGKAKSIINTQKSYTAKADYSTTDYIGKLFDGYM